MTAGSTANLLRPEDGQALLRIARASLEDLLGVGTQAASPLAFPERLKTERRGVFVTLTIEGRLRGCTGYVEGAKPLADAVRDLAVSSAAHDTRFEPVRPDELAAIHIDVSVLTPPHPIDLDRIAIGTHGLIARMAGRSGLLLPQVAPEWGWNREELLDHTCRKAGLPPDSWKRPECKILAFEAQIFEE